MIYKGPLKRRGGTQGDSGELLLFLLDHVLLMVKQKNKAEQYKVYRPVRYLPLRGQPNHNCLHCSPSHLSFFSLSLPTNLACALSCRPARRATAPVRIPAAALGHTHLCSL
jgi:Pleckstrin homology domain